jgi:putative ABC transport system permease protein
MNVFESIMLAFDSVRVNKLRASLTLLSIAIGVFAIVGAGTLVQSINNAVTGEMAALGENMFSIYRIPKIQTGNTWRKYRKRKPINYSQYIDFKNKLTIAKAVSSQSESSGHTVQYAGMATDPNVSLIGTDENHFLITNTNIVEGRPLTTQDIDLNRKVALIGNDVVIKVFPSVSPLGKKIKIGNNQYTVIGILEEKGAILGQSQDNKVIIPISQFLRYYASRWEESLDISVMAYNREALMPTIDEAIGLMRSIRDVQPWQENDFELETNESITEQFASFTGYLSYFGLFSGAIALIAAGVGIMNIMLVSVKERTREIGIRKAVGAKRFWILLQFIIETITLCQIGGFIGIGLGVLGGFMLANTIDITLSFPMDWVIISIVICTVLGVISGSYPAWKAATLDPIDALRYE